MKSTYRINQTENKYGQVSFDILERYYEDNKFYTEILYSYNDYQQALSKLNLLIKLNN